MSRALHKAGGVVHFDIKRISNWDVFIHERSETRLFLDQATLHTAKKKVFLTIEGNHF